MAASKSMYRVKNLHDFREAIYSQCDEHGFRGLSRTIGVHRDTLNKVLRTGEATLRTGAKIKSANPKAGRLLEWHEKTRKLKEVNA